MGYSAHLKKQRKPIVDYIEQNLAKLNDNNLADNEIFDLCDRTLKVVELKFNIEKKDTKLYNKYVKLILNDILPKKIFVLSSMKPQDYELSINKIKNKDLKFIYMYALKHYLNVAQLYNMLNQNIIDSWITEEGRPKRKVLLSTKNELIKKASEKNKNVRKQLKDHIVNIDKYVKEYYSDIKEKEFYVDLLNLITKVSNEDNIKKVIKEENQINFYSYHLNNLLKDLSIIEQLYDYSKERLTLIENYLNK